MIVRKLLPFAVVLLFPSSIVLGYLPGITGALYYDDFANLENLGSVDSVATALEFVRAGMAGPLGRPISLASFLVHAEGWPDNTPEILFLNTLIHTANASLLAILAYLILSAGSSDINRHKNLWIALGAAWLWAVMPVIASTSLIAIQRMTSLAAFWGLLGLIGFVYGYRLKNQPLLMTLVQGSTLGAGTALSMLSKENGILIPIYALVIDYLLVGASIKKISRLEVVRRVILFVPLLVVLYHLSPFKAPWFVTVDYREFSPWQRFQTEWVVLWDYVVQMLAPTPTKFGPFHDDWRLVQDPVLLGAAGTGWLVLILLTLFLAAKRINVWPLFAVAWFIIAHLLESTFLALELYFEHRNYLAFFGFCLALSYAAFSVDGGLKRVAPLLFILFGLFQFTVLLAVTSVWGKPLEAAEMWSSAHPASSRAAIHQAYLQVGSVKSNVADLNYRHIRRERKLFALERHDRTIEACPECIDVQLEALRYSCSLTSYEDSRSRLKHILAYAHLGRSPKAALDIMFGLREDLNEGQCESLEHSDLIAVLDRLRDSPFFASTFYQARLLFLSAALHEDKGALAERDQILFEAETLAPLAFPVLQYQVHAAMNAHDYNKARAVIARRESRRDVSAEFKRKLQSLHEEVERVERKDN